MAEHSGTWNYRIVRRPWGDGSTGEKFFAIHEAFYSDDKEKPERFTAEPAVVTGDTPEELADVLDKMREALTKPVLEYDRTGKCYYCRRVVALSEEGTVVNHRPPGENYLCPGRGSTPDEN
jgi:hypothetical protein